MFWEVDSFGQDIANNTEKLYAAIWNYHYVWKRATQLKFINIIYKI